ncbi:MAG: transporter [Rhodoglobus sp.]|uniref:transporter n=1 Tax=Salinibacterium sp. G-O1 TaxID=3046208 RepID=UPI0024BA081D|nr:transporter [Salinibacterium sp. G-O1]MDJ0335070.1 transporter [Salinibacterium sp. G-O1]
MVATLVKLRFLLLANSLRKSPWQLVAVILGGLYGLGLLVLAIAGLFVLRFADIEFARSVTVLAGAALVVGWTVLPVLTSGIDQTVEPARLATFPIPLNTLLLSLAISGVLGVPGLVTLVAALATAGTWWGHPLAALAAVVCAVIGVLTCVVGSRMLVALSSRISAGRRAREAKGILIFVPLLMLGPIILWVSQQFRDAADLLPRIANVVSWTPLGAIWAVPADIASGNPGRAGLEFLIGIGTLGAFLLLWRWGLARALESPHHSTQTRAAARGLGLFAIFPDTPSGAVASRALTYWMRDPRYAQSLITVPLVPILIFVYAGTNGNLAPLNVVAPIIAVLLSLSIYTDVSYDNTAFALHLQTGVSGRADRVGRVLALAVFAVPVCVVLAIGSVWAANTWEILPGLLGITIGILLTGFGVSSVISARFVFMVPAPGESPFTSKPGGGVSLMLSMFATWSILGILILPELVLAVVGFALDIAALGWLSLVVGITLGSTLLVIGIRQGGAILDRRGPTLLAQLQKQR